MLVTASELSGCDKSVYALHSQDTQLWRQERGSWTWSLVPMSPCVAVMGRATVPFHATGPWLPTKRCPARVFCDTGLCQSSPRPSRRTASSKASVLRQKGRLSSKQYGQEGRWVYRTSTCTRKQNSDWGMQVMQMHVLGYHKA